MFSSHRLKDPCQARTTRIDESWERGAIDLDILSQRRSIAESCEDPKSGIGMFKFAFVFLSVVRQAYQPCKFPEPAEGTNWS